MHSVPFFDSLKMFRANCQSLSHVGNWIYSLIIVLCLFFIFEIKLILFYCSILETMSRAEAMLDDKMHWNKVEKKTGNKKERVLLRPPAKMERERLLQTQNKTETTTPTPSSSYQNDRAANEYDIPVTK
jgi:hypothetical protein